ncbi:unnamed protein product [Lathyrus oleraceus]
MAMGINRVYCFIAILCIALVLHQGGARRYEEIMSDDAQFDCFDSQECPSSNEDCSQRCQRRGLSSGSCQGRLCCCPTNTL